MKCAKCDKDMTPPVMTPHIGFVLGVKPEDFMHLENLESRLEEYGDYCKRQFGKYQSKGYGICCECILDSIL